MSTKNAAWGIGLGIVALLMWGCASGGGGGGGGGEAGLDDTGIGGLDDEGEGGTDPGTDGENAGEGGTTEQEEGSGSIPIIDCSGAPVKETGVNLTPFYDEIPTAGLPAALTSADRPTKADLSEHLPPPCHQGQLRSCVAWAAGYGLMTYFASSRLDDWGDLDRSDHQFSPTFLFNQANGFKTGRSRAISCERAGAFVTDVLTTLQTTGCALMSDMPHINDGDCATLPSTDLIANAGAYRIGYFRKVDHDVDTMRTYLLQDLPVLVIASVDEEFSALIGDTIYSSVPVDGSSHAMLVCGYDDDRNAMKLFNSWGDAWGDGGYGWVSYDVWEDFLLEAWVAGPDLDDDHSGLTMGFVAGGNPLLDSDCDGYPDSMEYEFKSEGLNPNATDANSAFVMQEDADLDGWADDVEFRFGTDAYSADEYPYMAGYEYPEGFFDQFSDGESGVLESDLDLLDPYDTSDADSDGVPGSMDLCPDSTPGAYVEPDTGCELIF